MKLGCLVLTVTVALLSGSVSATRQDPQRPPVFTTTTTARVIDVVVRDKKAKPVVGLRKEDFRLTENGVAQEILDVTAVTAGEPAAAPLSVGGGSSGRSVAPPAFAQPTQATTAIVFERLSPESREPAKAAALKMLEGTGRSDESFGVFVLDLSLRALQPFTTDRPRLRKAVTEASLRATAYFEENRRGVNAVPEPPGLAARGQSDLADRVEEAWKKYTRIQQGYATTNALQAVAEALGALPGRKTIVYFSDGVAMVTDSDRARFDSAIAKANPYNVAIYPVDAVGLRVHSQEAANGQALRAAALNDAAAAGHDGAGGGAAATAEYIFRSGSTSTVFNRIASATGGFVVEDTNDLRRGVAAIDADRRAYYLLAYNPTNKEMDGTWRAVTVTVPGRKVTIRMRSGYLAAPERE
jgi:VWFA-related protein